MIPRPGDDLLDGLAGRGDPMRGEAPRASRRRASRLLRLLRRGTDWHSLAGPLLRLLRTHPESAHLQRIAAAVLGGANRRTAEALWRGVAARHPGSVEAFVRHADAVLRHRGIEALATLHARRFGRPIPPDPVAGLMDGLMLERLGRRPEAEDALRRSLTLDPAQALAWARLSALVAARGERDEAARLLAEGRRLTGDRSLRRKPPPPPSIRTGKRTGGGDAGRWREPLERLLAEAATQRARAPGAGGSIGGIAMIGGSLGGGGAERQLVATALGLAGSCQSGSGLGQVPVRGPVTIYCRRLAARGGHDFFLPALASAGVPVREYLSGPRWGGDLRRSLLRRHRLSVEALPERMREGTERLADALAAEAPDVVQIWQDGMVLAAGLAAALAGVPRIVLNVRTLPPNQRTDRWKPELEPLYRGLLALPGVVLTANSALAARAYEGWLRLPPGSAAVVPNGVEPLDHAGVDGDAERWDTFDRATGGQGFTVAGVMRMDANKRPLDWLAIAERLLRSDRCARFVLIGDGELAPIAREFARHRGIAGRTLFVGRTPHVGWWLARADALLLTSRFEGTPNVLIEAQHAGLPVVTTPAGAAAETIVPGLTGFVLDDAERIDVEQAARHLTAIANWSGEERAHVAAAARRHAATAYSTRAMLTRTLEVFAGARG